LPSWTFGSHSVICPLPVALTGSVGMLPCRTWSQRWFLGPLSLPRRTVDLLHQVRCLLILCLSISVLWTRYLDHEKSTTVTLNNLTFRCVTVTSKTTSAVHLSVKAFISFLETVSKLLWSSVKVFLCCIN
jgi:hypothetical protein